MLFRCRLALALGLTLAQVGELDSAEYSAWREYDALFSLPDDRADMFHMKEMAIGAASRGVVLGAEELRPLWWKHRPQPEEKMLSFAEAVQELKRG